jgi:hypothetical protein
MTGMVRIKEGTNMNRVVWSVVACLVLMGGMATLIRPWGNVGAQDDRTVTVTVYAMASGDVDEGSACLPDGVVTPWRQVIVTDAAGVIVGYVDIQQGGYIALENGEPACAIIADLLLDGSPFYTVAIDGTYRRTVSGTLLDEVDNQLFIPLV